MVAATIKGSYACPKGLRHGFGIAAVLEAQDFVTKMWA